MSDIVERARTAITTIGYAQMHGVGNAYPDSVIARLLAELVAEVERLQEWRSDAARGWRDAAEFAQQGWEEAERLRPRRIETVAELDALLDGWAMSENGSIFAPRSMQDIRDRLARADQFACDCLDSDHENALHDLALHDVPALLRLVGHLTGIQSPEVR